jgi:diguanylate cyclase (GGDEF)-like protein/PAS domain S-box-containing protein
VSETGRITEGGFGDDPSPEGTPVIRPDVGALVETWSAGLAEQIFLPMSRDELRVFLSGQAERLLVASAADPPDAATARAIGATLVNSDLVGADLLAATVRALSAHLPAGCADAEQAPVVLGAVTAGYVEALWNRILDQQESVRQAEVVARREMASALRSSEARFRAVFENAAIGILVSDMTGRIVEANPAMAGMLGYTVDELCRLRLADLIDAADAATMRETMVEMVHGRVDHVQMEKRHLHRDGSDVWTNLTVSVIRDADRTPMYTVAMVEDITGRRELQDRLRHQAMHDPLTQLPNRALFQERLAATLARPAGTVGVCYLDLDGFKMVNDRLGHDIGDSLLVAVGQRLAARVTGLRHLVARMGGDEFVVLVEDPLADELAQLAEDVLAALQAPFLVSGHELSISASIGLVECELGRMTPAELLKAADVTLYWAKSDGRGRWARFDPERNSRDMTRYTLSTTLLSGLLREEFVVDYQPLVRLADGRLHGVEALVRWRHPTLGRLAPDRFIDLAEETGSIVQLGHRVLECACAQAAAWNAEFPTADVLVSVNLTVRQAQEPTIVRDIVKVLEQTGLRPELLQLELTESALLGPGGQPIQALTELREAGIRLAVDDFGTGYSNLAYLRQLPLTELKLAGTLIDGLRTGDSAPDDPIVAMLVGLAHRLGLTVTAEAVETAEQADRLRAMGCDHAQGWHFARPAAPEAITEMLTAPARV